MTLPPVPDFERVPDLTRPVRKEIAEEIWRDVQTVASKVVITFDSHAIQILVYPPSDTTYNVPGRSPITGVLRDGLYQEG